MPVGGPPVVISDNGFPVTNTPRGAPMTVAANGRGAPVRLTTRGAPVYLLNPDGTPWSASQVIGGQAVGSPGATGTIYEGYTLADGDDFNATTTNDFLTPTNHGGAYMTTRNYGIQSGAPRYLRGAASLGGYEADPWHSGFADAGRGVVPSSFADMIEFGGSRLKLKSRRATTQEKALMGPLSAKNNLSSMIHMARRSMQRAPCIVDMRLRFPYALSTWDQWHPTFWVIQSQPGNGFDGLELDCEGFTPALQFNRNTWNNGVGAFGPTLGTTAAVSKTEYRTYAFQILQVSGNWRVRLYEEGVLVAEGDPNYGGNTFDPSRPFHIMMTNHILQSGLTQSVFDNAGATGAEMECDYWRGWMPSASTFRKPLAGPVLLQADFDTDFSFDLGSPASVWGAGIASDVIEMIPNEDNSPAQPWVRGLLPASVTRTGNILAGKISDQPGRLILARSVTPALGDGCKPQPITLAIGPRIVPTVLEYTVGTPFTFDLYAACDCGDLHMGAVRSVTGLPAWASYSASTGLVTGTPTDTGTTNLTISVINALGQAANKVVPLQKQTAPIAYAYESWTGPGWFDASNEASIVHSSNVVSNLNNRRSGGDNLFKGGDSITRVPNGQNGRTVLRFTRSTANPSRLSAAQLASSPLATMFQGNDKPYTVITVYKPTDTNTGFIWSNSATVDATNSTNIALIRRNATASSVRRQLVEATSNDVTFGSGQASGGVRIVAVKHTGTVVTIWDTSLTKARDVVAQDVNAFASTLQFRIGASNGPGSSGDSFASVACAMDFMEIVIEPSARSDADIQQAISDLATKWGISLV